MNVINSAKHSIFEMIIKDKTRYKALLRDLIVKSLIDLFEDHVLVRCLKRDEALVREVIPESKRIYENLLQKELGLTVNLTLILNGEQPLKERDIDAAEPIALNVDKSRSKR